MEASLQRFDRLGRDGHLPVQGVDLLLQGLGLTGFALRLGPLPLLDQLDQLELKSYDMVFQAGVRHEGYLPPIPGDYASGRGRAPNVIPSKRPRRSA